MYEKHLINITLLVFVSMCSGDLTSENVLAAIARQPYYYVINAFHSYLVFPNSAREIV